jgi:hypothetical protein
MFVILAAVALNRGRDLRHSMPLIRAREPVDAARLCDLDVDLRALASAAGTRLRSCCATRPSCHA